MQKIKNGDLVKLIAGKDKGKHGTVIKIIYNKSYPKKIVKVIVEGLNLVKKNKKANPAQNYPGEILSKEMPIHISNITLLDLVTNKPSKVGFKFVNQGQDKKKVRYLKATQEVIDG